MNADDLAAWFGSGGLEALLAVVFGLALVVIPLALLAKWGRELWH